jgi:hypothetical protein
MSKNVVLISGPGKESFNNKQVTNLVVGLERSGANVIAVGDGETPATIKAVEDAISYAISDEHRVTLFILAHGEVKDGKFVMDIDGLFNLTSESLFESIKRIAVSKPVDIFMTCCHGGAAIADVDKLPEGSELAVLTLGSDEVSVNDIDRLIDNILEGSIKNPCFSSEHLLDIYLCKSLRVLFKVCQGRIHISNLLGKWISISEMVRAQLLIG